MTELPARTRAPGIAPMEETIIYRPKSFFEPLDLDAMFPGKAPLEVELGAGDGSFLIQWSGRHPNRNFLGVERLLGRLRKIDKKCRRAGLKNVRLLRIEASYFMQYLLPPRSMDALHIYFPDPWPKRRHWKHRLITPDFAGSCARAFVPGGFLWVRTDNADYFRQIREVFGSRVDFREIETPSDLEEIQTDFEKGFLARGIHTLRAAWQFTHR